MEATTITNLDWIKEALSEFGESLDDIESISLSDEEMSVPVRWSGEVLGLDLKSDKEFLAWSKDYVYYQTSFDGHCDWICRVPRNPST
jgi:hypothetical protein